MCHLSARGPTSGTLYPGGIGTSAGPLETPVSGWAVRCQLDENASVSSVPNVLAARYASAEMVDLWSPEHKIVLERQLWIAVLRAQQARGVDVPDEVIEAYEAVVDQVDLESIDARERVTRHDVKARIEEFSALAGHEHIHKGMTSRDLTENVEQLQVRRSLELLRARMVAALARLAERAAQHAETVIAGRSHNVAAQATTLGKRFANAGEELLVAFGPSRRAARPLPAARHQGPGRHPAGPARPARRRRRVARRPRGRGRGAPRVRRVLTNVGQVYPRSLDLDVVSALVQAASGPSSLATTIRLMAGQRAGHRGLPARPGRLVGHAAQDEQPAAASASTASASSSAATSRWSSGWRATSGTRATCRARWSAGSRCPTRSSRSTACSRRSSPCSTSFGAYPAVIDARAAPLPAVPRHHQGPDGGGARRRRPRGGPRGHQGARRRRRARHARARQRAATTCSTGSRPTRGSASTRARCSPRSPTRSRSSAPRRRRSPRSWRRSRRSSSATPRRRPTAANPSCEASHPLIGAHDVSTLTTTPELGLPHLHSRQGPRHLRRRRRPAADGHVRPHLGLRRRDGTSRSRTRAACSPRCRRSGSSSWPTSSAATSSPPTWTGCPSGAQHPTLAGRVMLCRRAEMLPIECIVRGYLTGSAWKEYRHVGHDARHAGCRPGCASRTACPSRSSRRRPRPRSATTTRTSPSTRPSSSSGTELAEQARDRQPRAVPAGRGAGPPSAASSSPTPSSSSGSSTASWSSCDEVLTPDSSRFWPADEWEPGATPPSFDKQPVRDYLEALDWDKSPPPPAAARRRRRRHGGPLRRGLRAHHRPARSPTGRGPEAPLGLRRRCGRMAPMIFDVRGRGPAPAGDRRSAGCHHRAVAAGPRLRRASAASRVGKSIRFAIEAADEAAARAEVDDLCQRFLTNPVIEDADGDAHAGRRRCELTMAASVGVVLFPGSNCELDVVEAVADLGGDAEILWHGDDLARRGRRGRRARRVRPRRLPPSRCHRPLLPGHGGRGDLRRRRRPGRRHLQRLPGAHRGRSAARRAAEERRA